MTAPPVATEQRAAFYQPEQAFRLTDQLVRQLWRPSFPAAGEVQAAADSIPSIDVGRLAEGPAWRITVSPGTVRIWTRDEARAERTLERAARATTNRADMHATYVEEVDEDTGEVTLGGLPQARPHRSVTSWSRKSRNRMLETLNAIDYAPMFVDPARIPAMLTLTYPGDWLPVAPDGKTVKAQLRALRKRYERHYGEPFLLVWKLEFQRRGAPHIHMLIRPPHQVINGQSFREWVNENWVAIVDHPDPAQRALHHDSGRAARLDFNEGLKCTDPRRIGAYFSKHGAFSAKEYQNCVPLEWQEPEKGPGRFWGYWGLKPCRATRGITPEVGAVAGRLIRRWSDAQDVTHEVQAPRTPGGRVVSKYRDVIGLAGAALVETVKQTKTRKVRRRTRRLSNGRGWVSVNSGPMFALALGAALITMAH